MEAEAQPTDERLGVLSESLANLLDAPEVIGELNIQDMEIYSNDRQIDRVAMLMSPNKEGPLNNDLIGDLVPEPVEAKKVKRQSVETLNDPMPAMK